MSDKLATAYQDLRRLGGISRLYLCLPRPLPGQGAPNLVCHGFPVLQVVLSGVLPFRFSGLGGVPTAVEIGPGEGYFSLPWGWNSRDNHTERRMLMVRFQQGRLEYALSHWRKNRKTPPRWEVWHEVVSPDCPPVDHLLKALAGLACLACSPQELMPLACGLGNSLLEASRLPLLGTRAKPGGQQERWRRIAAYLEDSWQNPPSRQRLGEIFRVTPDHLTRLFRRYAGEPFAQYVCRLRIERARQLLQGGEMSVKEAAAFCGFHSSSYFIRAYKRITGHTPGGTPAKPRRGR